MKRLLLLGGGHTHLHVLHGLARQGLPGTEAILVTPFPQLIYTGMVPGLVAGHYRREECTIDLAPLAAAARCKLRPTHAVGLDAEARRVALADGTALSYDWLSVDTGAGMDREAIPGAREHALFVRPLEHFVQLWERMLELARDRVLRAAVIGGGAGGVELALAIKWRLRERVHVSLVTGGERPLAAYPEAVQTRALRALLKAEVGVLMESCLGMEAGMVHLANGGRLSCDAPIMAIGPSPPTWLKGTNAQLKEGYLAVDESLRSPSHANVFGGGDAVSRLDGAAPKSGVHAVRAGPPLLKNLRLAVALQPPQPYVPPARTLNLISCGGRYAIATYGDWSAEGRWVWEWKNWIDRRFVRRQHAVKEVA